MTTLTTEQANHSGEANEMVQEPVAQQDSDDRRLLREVLMLCEATEELEPTNEFMRGRIFEAKGIRRGIGTWYQDTFCGRSYMCEPVLNAAPVEPVKQEPVMITPGGGAFPFAVVCEIEQAEQEPVAFKFVRYVDGKEMAEGVTIEREKTLDAAIKKAVALCPNRNKTVLVYAAPVRTKDLTDDEIHKAFYSKNTGLINGIRAVIAKDREKNK